MIVKISNKVIASLESKTVLLNNNITHFSFDRSRGSRSRIPEPKDSTSFAHGVPSLSQFSNLFLAFLRVSPDFSSSCGSKESTKMLFRDLSVAPCLLLQLQELADLRQEPADSLTAWPSVSPMRWHSIMLSARNGSLSRRPARSCLSPRRVARMKCSSRDRCQISS